MRRPAPTTPGGSSKSGGDGAPPVGTVGSYRAPLDDIFEALDVAGLAGQLSMGAHAHVGRATVELALTEFGRIASEVIAPSDQEGDQVGARLDPATGDVRTPPPFRRAYATYVEGGWGALQFPLSIGGGGFPVAAGLALQEMFASANLALSLNPVLTQGAIELLQQWGDDRQRVTYLPHLLTGSWTGTMNLTEPDAGSDVGAITTKATPDGAGGWRVTGTKIFITWGQHDLADTIVHLVLARTPGAPVGTRGLSLFLVPRDLVDDHGDLGPRNHVRCAALEKKLGIHASPTCVMQFDGARCELVGRQHEGMRAMFTMMNAARISIGMQGPAVAERAYQQAEAYARTRRQGRAPGVEPPTRSPIIEHPDVRRMLRSIRTTVLAGRLLVYSAAAYADLALHGDDGRVQASAVRRANLLTPIAKAWPTDAATEACSTALQVFGGAGYVEESGIAQRLRDVRIAPIYEGTNGIQAIDLATRKVAADGGLAMRELLDEMRADLVGHAGAAGQLRDTVAALQDAVAALDACTGWIVQHHRQAPTDILAGAVPYLELAAVTTAGWLMLRRALRHVVGEAGDGLAGRPGAGTTSAQRTARAVAECNFFAHAFTSRATWLGKCVMAGGRWLEPGS